MYVGKLHEDFYCYLLHLSLDYNGHFGCCWQSWKRTFTEQRQHGFISHHVGETTIWIRGDSTEDACFHMNFHLVLTRVPPCGSTLKRKTWWRTKQIVSAAQWTFHCYQFLTCRSRIWFEHTGVLIPEKGLSFSSYLGKGQFFKTTSWLFGTTVWFTLPICLLI